MSSAGVNSLGVRFIALCLHAFFTFLLYDEKFHTSESALQFIFGNILENELQVGPYIFQTDVSKVEISYSLLIATSLIVNFVELLAMTLGESSVTSSFNVLSIILHMGGAFTIFFMIFQSWPIETFTPIFMVCSLLPMLISLIFSTDYLVLKSSTMKRLDIRI